jgi:hypothetical protein
LVPAENGNPLIPTMTAATTSGVTMTASSLLAGWEAWEASDGTTSGASGTYWLSAVESPTWLRTVFPAPVIVYEFEFAAPFASRAPVDFILRGRNGAGAWTTLFSATGETWSNGQLHSFRTDVQGLFDTYELYTTLTTGDGRTNVDRYQLLS